MPKGVGHWQHYGIQREWIKIGKRGNLRIRFLSWELTISDGDNEKLRVGMGLLLCAVILMAVDGLIF